MIRYEIFNLIKIIVDLKNKILEWLQICNIFKNVVSANNRKLLSWLTFVSTNKFY